MQLQIGYSLDEELSPIIPVLKGEVKSDIELVPIKVKGDELKFKINDLDLSFLPLPLLNFVSGVKLLSNGAFIVNRLGIKRIINKDPISSICVRGSNSTEYYFVKMILFQKISPIISESEKCTGESTISFSDYDISIDSLWEKHCKDCPIILDLIGSLKLDINILSKLKMIIRESARLQEERGVIGKFSKELGLKGRESVKNFFELCYKKKICTINFDSIQII